MSNYGHHHQHSEKSWCIRKGTRVEKVQLLAIRICAGTIENEAHKDTKGFPPISAYLLYPATLSSILQYNLQVSQLINKEPADAISKCLSK